MSQSNAATAIRFPTPTDLETSLTMIESMRKLVEAAEANVARLSAENKKLRDDASDYECEGCEELEGALDGAEERAHAMEPYIDDLVKVRHAIKRGTVNDDHIYQIERILSDLDSGWMCRA